MTGQKTNRATGEFELNPFVSDVARWVDCEVIDKQPEFKSIDMEERIARICLELHERGVAIMTEVEGVAVWIPTDKIEESIGGSSITTNPRFTRFKDDQSTLADKFQVAVGEHAKQRLASILEYTEVLFQLCNNGQIKIIGMNSRGSFLWGPTLTAAKRRGSREKPRLSSEPKFEGG